MSSQSEQPTSGLTTLRPNGQIDDNEALIMTVGALSKSMGALTLNDNTTAFQSSE